MIDSSCPRLSRASTSSFFVIIKGVDGRNKSGHDDERVSVTTKVGISDPFEVNCLTYLQRQSASGPQAETHRRLHARINRRRHRLASLDHGASGEAQILAEAAGNELHPNGNAVGESGRNRKARQP